MAGNEAGKTETATDRADIRQAQLLLNILPGERVLSAGDDLPPLVHWLHFSTMSRLSGLGEDGHALFSGGIIPDTGLPRRMWAGSRIRFFAPVKDGQTFERSSKLHGLERKSGRSGPLAFVTLVHEILADGVPAIREEQDLVFRGAQAGGPQAVTRAASPVKETWDAEEQTTASPVMLFRYSALTYNSHRIHYDRDYATGRENYPGLVVHGPLIATLLLDFALRKNPGRSPAAFEFRAGAPLFDGESIVLQLRDEGNNVAIQACDTEGGIAMTAKATLA